MNKIPTRPQKSRWPTPERPSASSTKTELSSKEKWPYTPKHESVGTTNRNAEADTWESVEDAEPRTQECRERSSPSEDRESSEDCSSVSEPKSELTSICTTICI